MLKFSDEMLSSRAICIPSMLNQSEMDVEVSSLLRGIVQNQKDDIDELFPDLATLFEDEARSPDTTMVETKIEMPASPVKIAEIPPQIAAKPQVIRNLVQPKPPIMVDELSGPCKSKNAIAARENRLKKKKYLEDLETLNVELKTENEKLKSKVLSLEETSRRFRNENVYLRDVLANSKELSELVKCVRSSKVGSKLSCPSLKRSSSFPNPLDATAQVPAAKTARTARQSAAPGTRSVIKSGTSSLGGTGKERAVGGVCLHVVNGQVSLEFCPQCSSSAAHFWLQQQSDEQPQ